MNLEKIVASLQQIKTLANDCLAEIGGPGRDRSAPKQTTKGPRGKTLRGHILRLREDGFFKQARTANDVRVRLQPVYPCDFDRVAMAFLRLQRRRKLRKTSKVVGKKKQIAYVG